MKWSLCNLRVVFPVYMWDKKSSCLKIIADNGQEYGKKNPIRVLYHGYGHYDVLQSPSDDPYLKLEDLDLSFINVSHNTLQRSVVSLIISLVFSYSINNLHSRLSTSR
ncbi:OTU domain-containing protein At3g57810-like [Camellia sinensis]|uniref:OTU domain-containing protein At3g57810-like n=1 Tax=Camellia sinensis TaxID=4442 RepID=UPI001035994E|nr:OTU domain-containing protein At3g57810-like [Camellia sinensis]